MNEIVNLVDDSFIFILVICVFLLVGITAAMIYFVVRYSEKRHPQADQSITGNTTLEVAWTIIPLILVLAMFFYGYEGFKDMRNVPPDAMTVKVTGKMWFWHFEYPTGKQSDTVLYLPEGKNVKFELMSVDVTHSFYVSAFRVKEDCVPGRVNYMWFNATKVGEYDIECAEYCGMNHSYMLGKVKVVPVHEYEAWVNKIDTVKGVDSTKPAPTGVPPGTPPAGDTTKPKTDTVKTTAPKTDTSKAPVKKDSLPVRKDTLKNTKEQVRPKNR